MGFMSPQHVYSHAMIVVIVVIVVKVVNVVKGVVVECRCKISVPNGILFFVFFFHFLPFLVVDRGSPVF